jgi:hypothetical protein
VLVLFSQHGVTPGRLTITAKKVLPRLREVATEAGAHEEPAPATPQPGSSLPIPVSLDDLPRIDLSMVDKGRTSPATPQGG